MNVDDPDDEKTHDLNRQECQLYENYFCLIGEMTKYIKPAEVPPTLWADLIQNLMEDIVGWTGKNVDLEKAIEYGIDADGNMWGWDVVSSVYVVPWSGHEYNSATFDIHAPKWWSMEKL